ncbi:MAG: alpha/beta hydrolase [Gammaproteobacteria bacterium]|nr:alpha/beta hydrolase [Gammaproteobacteria bacterium]
MPRSIQSYLLNGYFRIRVRPRLRFGTDIVQMRPYIARMDSKMGRSIPDQRITRIDLGGVPCDKLELPSSTPDRVVLHFHGGGFVFHTPRIFAGFLERMTRNPNATAYLPDYRLAPEHPFPAAPEDCLAAYRALLEQGTAPERIVITGDSAGGCLALVTLQSARQAGLPMPAAAVLLSPASELATESSSMISNARRDPMFHPDGLYAFRDAYLKDADHFQPLASPYYGDFTGLPPMLMMVGSSELLLEDTLGVARRARAAGVKVQAQVWRNMIHVFPIFATLPEAGQALDIIGEFMKTAWNAPERLTLPAAISHGHVPVNSFRDNQPALARGA